jgi:Spy/CpxP family protein refolding chaperone
MGLALSAELNGYPGPRHVLDLAGELGLTTEQQAQAQRLFDEMAEQAVVLGEQLIIAEAALDRLFAEKQAESVRSAALELGQLQGELRGHHLRYHLATRDLLSPHQVMRYQRLRGYGDGSPGHHAGHGHGEVR